MSTTSANFGSAAAEEIRIGSLESGDNVVLDLSGSNPSSFVRYASGWLLFVRDGSLLAQPFDAGSRKTTGDPVPVAENVGVADDRYGSFAASDTGVLVYGLGSPGESRLVWKDRTGRQIGELGPPGEYTNVSLSPDQQRVAVSLSSGSPPNRDIWTIDLLTASATGLTFDRTLQGIPTWSPDGSILAFVSGDPRAGSRYNLSMRDSVGRGAQRILVENQQEDRVSRRFITDWSDDGRHIVYTQGSMITSDVWTQSMSFRPATGGGSAVQPVGKPTPFVQSEFIEDGAVFAPGSRWIAYQSNATGIWEVFVEPFPSTGERHQVSRGGGTQPAWRGHGRELFFLTPSGDMMAVETRLGPSFQSGTPQRLFSSGTDQTVGTIRHTYAVTRDGQRFLINVPQRFNSQPLTALVNWPRIAQER